MLPRRARGVGRDVLSRLGGLGCVAVYNTSSFQTGGVVSPAVTSALASAGGRCHGHVRCGSASTESRGWVWDGAATTTATTRRRGSCFPLGWPAPARRPLFGYGGMTLDVGSGQRFSVATYRTSAQREGGTDRAEVRPYVRSVFRPKFVGVAAMPPRLDNVALTATAATRTGNILRRHMSSGGASSFASSSSSKARNNSGPSSEPAKYHIARISSDGAVSMESLRVPEILRGSSSMHARDLFSLALTSHHDVGMKRRLVGGTAAAVRRPPAVILPRGEEVVMSFGSVRALIGHASGMIFDAHKPSIQLLAAELSETFDAKAKEAQEYSTGENLIVDDNYNVHMKYIGEPFELVFIEEVLRDSCDTFNRRLRVYEPIVDTFMSRITNEVFSDSGVQKLVPIKDSLQDFELTVKQCLECLTHLLENDEDMLALLLTERAKAAERGEETLRPEMHEKVELLFEEYARQLSNVLHEIHFLLRRVQSKQELVALSLDAYRNRMIRMNVYLSMVGVGLATATTVAGYYGMNLINGLEESPVAFNNVVMSTSIAGLVLFMACTSYLSGTTMRRRAAKRLEEIETISGALGDMGSLDYTVKVMLDQGRPMNKEEFAEHLRDSRQIGALKAKEVDLLFELLDMSQDGTLNTEDFRSIESFGHSPAKQCKISHERERVPLVSDTESSRQQFVGPSARKR